MKRMTSSALKSDGLKRGPWGPEEDDLLMKYIETHGVGRWSTISKNAGLMRGGKSCRLRWMNHLRPNIKHGQISPDEEDLIIRLHNLLGNRWALIAGRVPGRTDNDVKNYWNTYLSKKLAGKGTEPKTHDKSQQGPGVKGRPFCADLTGERHMKIDRIVHQASGAADTNTLTKDTHVSHKLDGCQFNSPEETTVEPVNCFINKDHSHALSDFHSLERTDSSANYIQDFVPNSAATRNIITAPRPSIEWSKTHEASVSEKDNEAIVITNIDKSDKPADELYNQGNILYDQINSNGLILDEISDRSIPAACGSEQNADKFWESSFVFSNSNHNNWFECLSIPCAGSYGMGDFINNYDFVYSGVRYEETRSVSDENPLLIRSEL